MFGFVNRTHLPETAIPDRRLGSDRVPTMRLATLRLNDGEESPCVIRDLSLMGAKLSVSGRYKLPALFHLIVHGYEAAFPVRRVWQRGDLAGVTLVTPETT